MQVWDVVVFVLIGMLTFLACGGPLTWLSDFFGWNITKKKEYLLTGIFLILWLISWAGGMGVDYYISNTNVLESQEEIMKIEEEYSIIKGKQQTDISGYGFGMTTFYRMRIESKDRFAFYFLNEDGEFERKKVDFDFVIKEENEDKAYFRVYEKYKIEKHCNRWTGECWEEEKHVNFSADKKVLIVPKGTVQKEPISLD